MYRGCRTSQVINFIYFRFIGKFHIMKYKFKVGMLPQVNDVLLRTGEKIIQAYYFVPVLNQPGT